MIDYWWKCLIAWLQYGGRRLKHPRESPTLVPFNARVSSAAYHRLLEEAERRGLTMGELLGQLAEEHLPRESPLWYRAPRRWWLFWEHRRVTLGDVVTDVAMKCLPVSKWEQDEEDE